MRRDWLYVGAIGWLAFLLTILLAGMLEWRQGSPLVGGLWIAGFFFVALNLCYLVVVCLVSIRLRARRLPEAEVARAVRTAILYVVKNEPGDFAECMRRTMTGNNDPANELWLISNSDDEGLRRGEDDAVRALREEYGPQRVRHFRPDVNPLGRKHVAIAQWARAHRECEYFIVCDADSVLYPGAVARLVAKAEHPANRRFMVFQSHLQIDGSRTRFARFLEPGQNIVQKAFCEVNFALFGQSPYYGHGALIRRAPFARLRVPAAVLSHDLWDTAAIDRAGWGIAFCSDVQTREMFPADYLEFRRRSRRWIVGTLEAWPLLFRRRLSLGTRFHLALANYIYIVQPVFLLWVLLGLLAHNSLAGPLLKTQAVFLGGSAALDFEMGGISVATVGLMWAYKQRFARGFREALLVLRDAATGTAVLLNNLFYDSLFILLAPWTARHWRPMRKDAVPERTFSECFRAMLPSTAFGALLLGGSLALDSRWTLYSSPILFSFLFGSALVYWTSRPARAACPDDGAWNRGAA